MTRSFAGSGAALLRGLEALLEALADLADPDPVPEEPIMAINVSIPTPSLPSASTMSAIITYGSALATIAYAAFSFHNGTMDANTAIELAIGGTGLGALGHRITATQEAAVAKAVAQLAPPAAPGPQP